MENIVSSTIKNTAEQMLKGSLNPVELIKISLERAKNANKFNAFITINEVNSKAQSLDSQQRYTKKSILSELDGIPIAIKDNFCLANLPTTCASKMLHNFVPPYNATVCERLLGAGAILLGKTNMDEFAMGSGTVDSIFGPSTNPWGYKDDDFHITGGSSGGSAISVLTGSCFAGIGSDTGGSVRNPASYCGLVGLKPTYGSVSRYGLIPLVNSMDVPGILTRNVDDCVAVLNAVAGHDEKDSTTIPRPHKKIRLPPAEKLSVKGLKIGIPVEYHSEYLHSEVYSTWNDICNLLDGQGAIIKQISMPNTEHSIVCYSILNQAEVASNMAKFDGIEYGLRSIEENTSTEKLFATNRSKGFNEIVRGRILSGNYFLLTRNYEKYFNKALKVRRLISEDFYNAWDQVQVLLTPTTLTTAPKYKDFVSKKNREQCSLQDYCTQPANMAGVPAVSIPITLSKGGMPISLQLIGRNLSEPMLLALAKYIENAVQFPSCSHF